MSLSGTPTSARLVPAMNAVVGPHGAPGVVAAWGTSTTLSTECAGTLSDVDADDGCGFPATADTVYDLASLTKLLATTVLLADAVEAGRVDLAETPWPRWPDVSVEQVARHEGGLPAWMPFFQHVSSTGRTRPELAREEIVAAALGTPPTTVPGAATIYSDVGFVALGALLEDRLGGRLDVLLAAHPLCAGTGIRFVPLDDVGYHPALPLVAPTERCGWRRRRLQGQVHDDNAYAMGGVAGHAGLFGSLVDVATVAQRLLTRLRTPGDVLCAFSASGRSEARPHRRPIGFDIADVDGSTLGVLGPAVGHLGFTGTSLWMNAADDRFFAVLANTPYYGREDTVARNRSLRRTLHAAFGA